MSSLMPALLPRSRQSLPKLTQLDAANVRVGQKVTFHASI